MIKKKYAAPCCDVYTLPSGMLMQNDSVKVGSTGETVSNTIDIGFSKSFEGGLLEEEEELNEQTNL